MSKGRGGEPSQCDGGDNQSFHLPDSDAAGGAASGRQQPIKAALVGTYRAIDQKHVSRWLAEVDAASTYKYDLDATSRLGGGRGNTHVSLNRQSDGFSAFSDHGF
ncbi:MAG TPA: hypothetical protein VJX94_28395 [Stellaceae bacterium]|nr:hypothetical protein [Stellaceae bacterium]